MKNSQNSPKIFENMRLKCLKGLTIVVLGLLGLGLTGCADAEQREILSTVSGASVGGVLGAQFGDGTGQFFTTGTGVVLGTFIGQSLAGKSSGAKSNSTRNNFSKSSVGQSRAVDARLAQDAFRTAFYNVPLDFPVTWENPVTKNSGSYTPFRHGYHPSKGWLCRDIIQTIQFRGRIAPKTSEARACATDYGDILIFEP